MEHREEQLEVLHLAIQKQITQALLKKTNVFFVQIGSNDGIQGDPINTLISGNKTWRGIFIEPIRHIFDRLVRNYGSADRFVFENLSIGKNNSKKEFYYVSEKAKEEIGNKLPYWYDQLGSFNRNHIIKFLDGILKPYIISAKVECMTLDKLLDKHNVRSIDLLHIDTEGYDYSVLSQLNFDRYTPLVILYEHKHLPVTQKVRALTLLKTMGYTLTQYGEDTLAIINAI